MGGTGGLNRVLGDRATGRRLDAAEPQAENVFDPFLFSNLTDGLTVDLHFQTDLPKQQQ